jgi:hypothetical protein
MNVLARYIEEGIEQKGCRYVFDSRLDAVWPVITGDRAEQQKRIAEFATMRGWSVRFLDEGRTAVFRKRGPPGSQIESNKR